MDAGKIRRLFLAALEVEAAERRAFLERAEVDAAEREAVLELLSYDRGEDGEGEATIGGPIEELRRGVVSGRFGPYEVEELIGRGGMGAVYKATRVDGEIRQTVAIKVMEHAWLDSKAIERFRRERQLLAGLAHANIARLLDTGTREDGRPYLVMEFIEGEALDEYCRRRALGDREKLRLLLPLCRAVEYAHSKLVIHRDLKPSNVMVTAGGEPKLLDFGIAGVLDEAGAAETNTVQFTPSYGSPEQARGEAPSTAMDVYGLGAVMYFLMTGVAPHAMEGLTPAEAMRRLWEEEPVAPSAIRRELKGDIENIIRKAMHREPGRRFAGARELADDIERYLTERPVSATPDTLLYRAGRFARRRRWGLVAGAVACLAIAAGCVMAWAEKRRANEEAAIAAAVSEFLQKDLIAQAGLRSQIERGGKPDPDLKVRTLLDRAAERVSAKFAGMPKVEAAIRIAMGGAYQDLGLEREAARQYERALALRRGVLGKSAAGTLEAANLLGTAWWNLGKREEAKGVFEETLRTARGKEGARAAAEARYSLAMMAAADKKRGAVKELGEAIEGLREVKGAGAEQVLAGLNQMAVLELEAGHAEEAERLLRGILEERTRTQGLGNPDTLASMSELGVFYFRQSRFEEGERLLKQSAEGMEATLGRSHPVTLSTLNNLSFVYTRHGRYEELEAIRLRILEGLRAAHGASHPDAVGAAQNLASAYRLNGKYGKAAELYEEVVREMRKMHGTEHPRTLLALTGLTAAYREIGRLEEAEKVGSEALAGSRRVLGEHTDTSGAMLEVARVRMAQGRWGEAERLHRETLALRIQLLGENSQATLMSRHELAGVLQATGRFAEAERLHQQVLAARRKMLGEGHPSTLNSKSELASVYRKQGRWKEAGQLQGEVIEARRKTLGGTHPNTLRAMRELAGIYREVGKCAESKALMATVLEAVKARGEGGERVAGLGEAELRREMAGCRGGGGV